MFFFFKEPPSLEEELPINEESIENLVEKSSMAKDESPQLKLPNTVTRLTTKEGSEVYLVGTAHFSKESQDDVANVRLIMNIYIFILCMM